MGKEYIQFSIFTVGLFLSMLGLAYVSLIDKYMPNPIAAGVAIIFSCGVVGCLVMIMNEDHWNV